MRIGNDDGSDDEGELEEAPIGQGLYEELADTVAELNDMQAMAMVNALRHGTPWDDLPQWQKNLYIELDS